MAKNRIAEFRRKYRITQRQLGQVLGVSQTTISAWEHGRNEPDIGSIFVMADYFDVTPKKLMGYVDQCEQCDFQKTGIRIDFSCEDCACNHCQHIHSCKGQCGDREGNA